MIFFYFCQPQSIESSAVGAVGISRQGEKVAGSWKKLELIPMGEQTAPEFSRTAGLHGGSHCSDSQTTTTPQCSEITWFRSGIIEQIMSGVSY